MPRHTTFFARKSNGSGGCIRCCRCRRQSDYIVFLIAQTTESTTCSRCRCDDHKVAASIDDDAIFERMTTTMTTPTTTTTMSTSTTQMTFSYALRGGAWPGILSKRTRRNTFKMVAEVKRTTTTSTQPTQAYTIRTGKGNAVCANCVPRGATGAAACEIVIGTPRASEMLLLSALALGLDHGRMSSSSSGGRASR